MNEKKLGRKSQQTTICQQRHFRFSLYEQDHTEALFHGSNTNSTLQWKVELKPPNEGADLLKNFKLNLMA